MNTLTNLLFHRSIACIVVFLIIGNVQKLFSQTIQFDQSYLDFNGFPTPSSGTSLKFGPDGRLYLAQLKGLIRIYTVQADGPNYYKVVAHEVLNQVQTIPNHDDTGALAWDGRSQRQITGIEVVGTAQNPVIYVGSSDPKWGGPSGDKALDTNSGVITRITWTGTSWEAVDLVRGLPRSEENHSTNAVKYATINGKPYLLVASGGFTNGGAPSNNFAWITEYALAAAILSVDLGAIASLPVQTDPQSGRKFIYDIPTLDDPSRPNANEIYNPNQPGYNGIDVGDPWGGNDGLNMGMVVADGPVQVFSAGYRNAYDFVVTESGKVFVTDNGPNSNWGGLPENEGNATTITNRYLSNEPGNSGSNRSISGEWVNNQDHLELIATNISNYTFGSYYGGHPTPIRANPGTPYILGSNFPYSPGGAGLYTKSVGDDSNWSNITPLYTPADVFRTQILEPVAPGQPGFEFYAQNSLPVNWPPVPPGMANPNEADYRDPALVNPNGPQPTFVTIWKKNSNGIAEYTASNFNGAIKGALVAGRNEGYLHLVRLNEDGSLLTLEEDKWNLNGGNSLGITCQGDFDIFPGTIWVATFNSQIRILTPSNVPFCPSPADIYFDPEADYDGDGFTNQDEIENGTDYCSGASAPKDFDKDLISDLNDPDDDNDGILDENDSFQLGGPTELPIVNELFSDNTDALGRPFGYLGLGLTGLMNNGAPNPNWLQWIDQSGDGPLPDDIYGGAAGAIQMAMTGGTADGNSNNQRKGFQFGAHVGLETGEFIVNATLVSLTGPQLFYDITHNGQVGIQIGDGSQSNFLKLVFTKSGIVAAQELQDVPDINLLFFPIAEADRPQQNESIEFFLVVNPILGTTEPRVKIGSRPIISLGTKNLSGKVLEAVQEIDLPLAIGVYGSSLAEGVEFLATYGKFSVTAEQPYIKNPLKAITRQVNSPNRVIVLSEYFDDSEGVENLVFTVQQNSDPTVGLGIVGDQLTISFPENPTQTTVVIRATDQDGFFKEQAIDIIVVAAEQLFYRINAGGEFIAGLEDSPNWVANDAAGLLQGVGYTNNGGISKASGLSYSNRHSSIPWYIDENTFDAVFAFKRENDSANPLTYQISLPNGNYKVNLYLGQSDPNFASIGARVFDILLKGNPALSGFDPVQNFGIESGGILSFMTELTDGLLDIQFVEQVGKSFVHGIEIIRTDPVEPIVIVNSIPNQVSTESEELPGTLLFTASGGVGTLSYRAENLPPGVDLEPVNGRIYGTLASNASIGSPYQVTLWVKDSNQPIANEEFITLTWEVQAFDSWKVANEDENYTARHENSFVQAGEAFYLMGGRESSTTIDIYNYSQNTWRSLPSVAPRAFNHFQAIEYKGYIWVIGAFENNNFPDETPASHIWIFDPIKEQYIQGPEIPVDRRRGSAGLVVYKDKFYIVGGNRLGHNGLYVDYFDEFDPATATWRVLPSAPRPRDHFSAVVIGDKLYAVSGRLSGGPGGTFGPVIKEVDVYDFISGTWSTLPTASEIPTARAGAVVAKFKNKIIVAGGEIPGAENTNALDVTEVFDPENATWSQGPNLKFRRHGTQGIVSGKGLFVTAGSPVKGGGRQKNMEYLGLNEPSGTPLVSSQLSLPEDIELDTDGNATVELSAGPGNQAVFIRSLSFVGTDASDFVLLEGPSNGVAILPNSAISLSIQYQGSKASPQALLRVNHGTNSSQDLLIFRNSGGTGTLLQGLRGYWKMDEGSGNTFIDASGSGNNAVIQNTSGVFWSPGVVGHAVNLNGNSGRYALAPHNSSLEINTAITISGWVNPKTLHRGTMIYKSAGKGFELWLDINGLIEFRLNRASNGSSYKLVSTYNYSGDLGKWIHVAATFDGSTSRIYINGVQNVSANYSPFTIGTTSGNLVIGALGTVQRFNGFMDDLRLYDRALSPSEIFTLFSGEPQLPEIPETSLPLNGSESEDAAEVNLSWTESLLASGYRVQISTTQDFVNLVLDSDVGNQVGTTAFNLQPETIHYWRVKAYNQDGESDWSVISSFRTAPLSGLVGHWKMDEGSGNTFIDASGSGNNAVIQNTSGVFWSPGVVGHAVNLNGNSGRYALAPHNSSLEINTAITISGWVNPKTLHRGTMIYKSAGKGFELWLDINGLIEFRLNRASNGSAYKLVSTYNYSGDLGKWIHVAATFDGSNSRIYINGVQNVSANYSPFTIGTSSGNLVIGALGTVQRFNGFMDDLRLYNRSLSASEISALAKGNALRTLGEIERYSGETSSPNLLSNGPDPLTLEGNGILKLYPNPVDEILHLSFSGSEGSFFKIGLFDTKGVKFMEREFVVREGRLSIPVKEYNLRPGIHLLVIRSHENYQILKFIKK